MENLLGLSFDQINIQLSLMKKEHILQFQKSNTDITLQWKVPREDNYTLNPFLKTIANQNQLK